MDDKQNFELQTLAQNSLDIMSAMIALAFKWDKKEYKDKINLWMQDFAKSMSEEEKKEFVDKISELGLIEKK